MWMWINHSSRIQDSFDDISVQMQLELCQQQEQTPFSVLRTVAGFCRRRVDDAEWAEAEVGLHKAESADCA